MISLLKLFEIKRISRIDLSKDYNGYFFILNGDRIDVEWWGAKEKYAILVREGYSPRTGPSDKNINMSKYLEERNIEYELGFSFSSTYFYIDSIYINLIDPLDEVKRITQIPIKKTIGPDAHFIEFEGYNFAVHKSLRTGYYYIQFNLGGNDERPAERFKKYLNDLNIPFKYTKDYIDRSFAIEDIYFKFPIG